MSAKRIVIAGGSGFIGHALERVFSDRKFEVVILTRTPRQRADDVREIQWDGRHDGPWWECLDGAEAVINLTGKNINCPHNPANLQAITASRVNSVKALAAALPQLAVPPRVWVQASATGFYGDTGDVACTELAPAGRNLLAQICTHWEDAFTAVVAPQTRKVTLRIGFVLGRNGGALPVLSALTRRYLGGAAGSGRQYISWIHLVDLVEMFVFAVHRQNLKGPLNAVAPHPVTNAEFMRELRRALHRPWCPPAPAFAVRLGSALMKSEPSLALVSTRCLPEKFLELEFRYHFAQLHAALADLCGKP